MTDDTLPTRPATPTRTWRRFIADSLIATIAALAVVGGHLLLRDRAVARQYAVEADGALERRVAEVQLDLRDPRAALAAIERAAGVRVEVDGHLRDAIERADSRPGAPATGATVRLRGVSVRGLLRTVLRHAGVRDGVCCEPAGDVVRLAVDRPGDAGARVVRLYDLRGAIERHRAWRLASEATGGAAGSVERFVGCFWPVSRTPADTGGLTFSTVGAGAAPGWSGPAEPDADAVIIAVTDAPRRVDGGARSPSAGGWWAARLAPVDHRRVREVIEWMRSSDD